MVLIFVEKFTIILTRTLFMMNCWIVVKTKPSGTSQCNRLCSLLFVPSFYCYFVVIDVDFCRLACSTHFVSFNFTIAFISPVRKMSSADSRHRQLLSTGITQQCSRWQSCWEIIRPLLCCDADDAAFDYCFSFNIQFKDVISEFDFRYYDWDTMICSAGDTLSVCLRAEKARKAIRKLTPSTLLTVVDRCSEKITCSQFYVCYRLNCVCFSSSDCV